MTVWSGDWAWSMPLIVVSVIYHVICFAFINEKVAQATRTVKNSRHFIFVFALVMGVTTLLATILHASKAAVWAVVYWLLRALPDYKSAMLYSLNAMTTYGHESAALEGHWRLMGALEALNGVILFGLTTAFLYAMIQAVWSGADSTSRDSTCAH